MYILKDKTHECRKSVTWFSYVLELEETLWNPFINNYLSASYWPNFSLLVLFQLTAFHVINICSSVLMTSADVNDPAALSQSVSLSYLSAAYLIQGISSLLQAVLTFRQAGPFQRELLAHKGPDNLVGSETCFPPSFLKLSVSHVSFHSYVSVTLCLFLSSPFLPLVMHLSLPDSVLHLRCICISISYQDPPSGFCSVLCSVFEC